VGYVLLFALIAGWRGAWSMGLWLVGAHGLLLLSALTARRLRPSGGARRFVAEVYPLVLLFALYRGVGAVNEAWTGTFDDLVMRWEGLLFGFQPSLSLMDLYPSGWLSSTLHAAYLSKYLMLAGAPALLWLSGRVQAARRVILLVMVTYYVCFTLHLLFPVAGPRYLFPLSESAAAGTGVAVFAHALVGAGSAWGTAFPSSHVAATVTLSVATWIHWRCLGGVLLIVTTLLTVGTVYGQFHYAVDAGAGVALGAAVLLLRNVVWRGLPPDSAGEGQG
jgi:hypothetical protein